MQIDKWMNRTYPVFSEKDTVDNAIENRKSFGISTVITVDSEGRLSGVVDIDDLTELPSATLLGESVKEPVLYCTETDFIEDAALMLIESHSYLLPVVDEDFVVTGIIGVFEILEGLMEFTAMDRPGARLSIVLTDKPGALRDVVDFLAEKEINILSIITAPAEIEGQKRVVIRTDETDIQYIAEILEENGISFESISEEEGFGV